MPQPHPNAILAHNLRALRRARGWSQEVMAERCGLHRTYVGAIERGERNVTLETLNDLAIALRTSPAELISESRGHRGKSSIRVS
ncbi:MAG: helix-turn-helix transcriptional regulator [Acidobacteriia bacterium]|nr:helix-turn-helix transcriptional regulator [Terriglobia bacterium]